MSSDTFFNDTLAVTVRTNTVEITVFDGSDECVTTFDMTNVDDCCALEKLAEALQYQADLTRMQRKI
jgi:hypothetical protein